MSGLSQSRIFNHILKSWRHQFALQMATIVVMVACFVVIAGALSLRLNLEKILTLWGDSMQMSVYISDSATGEQISAIESSLKNNDKIKSAQFISKEKAAEALRDQMSSYAPDLLKDIDLIKVAPVSFQVELSAKIAPSAQLEAMQEISQVLKALPGVEEVNFGQDWIKNYVAVTQTLSWGGLVFILIVLTAAAFVIANSMRSSIYQRKNEIEVMELVGATSKYIRGPYIWEGAILGTLSSGVAVLVCYAGFLVMKEFLAKHIAFLQLTSHLQFLTWDTAIAVILFGALIGILSAWLCVRQINDGWAASRAG